ncbi:MAG: PD40 domain-containing protein [Planctomycetes bacterium]|nr:PD40 domain-containing protein [Planctomycetota bacterium]
MVREACERDECRTPASPEDLQVVQVTSDPQRVSHAYYLDCPSWTRDSRYFVFRREASDDGLTKPEAWICDVRDGFSIRPICKFEGGVGSWDVPDGMSYGAVLSPGGDCAYHLLRAADRVEVRRVDLDTLRQEAIASAPVPLVCRGAFSISADGERVLMGNFLGDGKTEGAPWGAYIFDVRKGAYNIIEFGNGYRNMHCQYSHNPLPPYSHDILLNHEHVKLSDGSWLTPPDGSWRWKDLPPTIDNLGSAYSVVRDDGANWRMIPVGRAPAMTNGGHNTWRGQEYSVVTSAYNHLPGRWRAPLLEAAPMPVEQAEDPYLGQTRAGSKCVDLTRRLARADSCHFGFDESGRRFVSDSDGYAIPQYSFLFVGTYVEPVGENPFVRTRYLLLPRTSWRWKGAGGDQASHPHPYLSPDGKYVVFQSDFSGRPQVHVAYGFEYP